MSGIGRNRVSPEPLHEPDEQSHAGDEEVEQVDLPEVASPRKENKQTTHGWEEEKSDDGEIAEEEEGESTQRQQKQTFGRGEEQTFVSREDSDDKQFALREREQTLDLDEELEQAIYFEDDSKTDSQLRTTGLQEQFADSRETTNSQDSTDRPKSSEAHKADLRVRAASTERTNSQEWADRSRSLTDNRSQDQMTSARPEQPGLDASQSQAHEHNPHLWYTSTAQPGSQSDVRPVHPQPVGLDTMAEPHHSSKRDEAVIGGEFFSIGVRDRDEEREREREREREACRQAHTHVHTCARAHIHTHTREHTHKHIHTRTRAHTPTHTP